MSGIDIILILCLISALAPWGLSQSIEPSWTRDLVSSVVLVGCAFGGEILHTSTRWRVGLSLAFAAMCALGTSVWVIYGGSNFGLNFWAGWSPWLLSAAFLLFGLTFARRRWQVWRQIFVATGVLVAALQDIGIIGKALGVIGTQTSQYGDFYGVRTFHASLALLIVLAFVLALTGHGAGRRNAGLATFLGISVVLSQHRSVWVGLTIVTLLMLVRYSRDRAPRDNWIALCIPFTYLVIANLAPLIGLHLLPKAGETAPERGLADAATSSNSLEWRLEMWRTRLVAARDPDHWLFGGVSGVNPVKWPGSGVMNPHNSAHNMLVDVSVMLGLVGVIVVLAIFIAATLSRADRLDPVAIFLWGLLGYGTFYYWPAWSWVVIGAALTTSDRTTSERAEPA